MVIKNNDGYECKHCGKKGITNKSKASEHEAVCAESPLNEFFNDSIGNLIAFETGERGSGKSQRQLKIGSKVVGKCSNCDRTLDTSNVFDKTGYRYECPKCGNINFIGDKQLA